MLAPPIQHLAAIEEAEADQLLIAWGHRMGPCRRPYQTWAHAMFRHGQPVAVTVTATLIKPEIQGLSRAEACELARLCADGPALNRVMLRLWREMIFPELAARHGWRWAISYQNEAMHTGATYRLDGWIKLGRSRSGSDQRSGRRGYSKTIWGWSLDAAAMAERRSSLRGAAPLLAEAVQ